MMFARRQFPLLRGLTVTPGGVGAIRGRMRLRDMTGEFGTMPRFVIVEHDHPTLHWDLMLEVGLVLRAWRLEALPRDGERISATAINDHRLLYLDYEGPISGG